MGAPCRRGRTGSRAEGLVGICLLLVRFWPVTLVGLILGFGLLKIPLQR
jgi:hypothetical protein